jgi:hypothetical protein
MPRRNAARGVTGAMPGVPVVVGLEIGERHDLERAAMGRLEEHLGRLARLMRLEPARRAEAPAVAVLEAGEAVFGAWRGKIVAAGARELEELGRHQRTDRVRPYIVGVGLAAAATVPTRLGRVAAGGQRIAEDVDLMISAAAATVHDGR